MRPARIAQLFVAVMLFWAGIPAQAGIEDVAPPRWEPNQALVPGEQIADPPPPSLQFGSQGPDVLMLQQRLAAAGFSPGEADSEFGRATRGAVYAFQKVYGLERTGIFRPQDWSLLDRDVRGPGPAPEANRVEIDLDRQILFLIEGEQVAGVFPISSANGASYRNARGRLISATTPEGRFTFRRRREGWWESYLGFLYRPFYFHGGYAIHGSNSVPPVPASHGCVRVELTDMDFLATRLSLGMTIYIYGKHLDRDQLIAPVAIPPPPSQPIV
jgi:peptidoglycan hydrolase-like protein with peptidoglycan-binding domain